MILLLALFVIGTFYSTNANNDTGLPVYISNQPPIIEVNNEGRNLPELFLMTMKVDNFNAADKRTWNMRYYYNSEHAVWDGPLFIYLGGEWEIEPNAIRGGQIYDMAREHKGYLFYTEHRYYGKSYPTPDSSTSNLKYLSVEQGMADIAAFITSIKSIDGFKNSKVVVVGGSYAGTIATWLRIKYPNLINAAYASSAPLLAIDDYKQYFEVVGKSIKDVSSQCYSTIREATKKIEELFGTSTGRQKISQTFNTCKQVSNSFPDKDNFFSTIANYFAIIVQNARAGSILQECNNLLTKSGDPIDKLGAFIKDRRSSCMGDYNNEKMFYSQTQQSPPMNRPWLYQCCSQFGFFLTGNSNNQPFGVNWQTTLGHQLCKDVFGSKFTKAQIVSDIAATNSKYGGLNPKVTKVVSIHGTVDPWHSAGLTKDVNTDAPVIIVPGTSHCADLSSISSSDSQAMKNAKQKAKDYIKKWIS